MGLINAVKKVVSKVAKVKDDITAEYEQEQNLERWKNKLTTAMSEHDKFRADCAVWDAMYHGTKAVGSNMGRGLMSDRYDRDQRATANARQVVNITYQLIESQIDPSVPLPAVDPIEIEDQERKEMIEGMLTYMSTGPELKRIVSENERISKKNSLCIMKVGYNPDHVSHSFRGRIETTNPHPVNVIPQPGVYRVKDMDYLFHIEDRTIDYVCRRYGEELRDKLEGESAEYSHLEHFGASQGSTTDSKGKLSVVECWYKDKDGDVCVIVWANDEILKDTPKFFYKRDEQGNTVEFDEVEMEQADEQGNVVSTQAVKVPVRVPKQFPFVIQYNIPREKSYYGKSDPDVIFDQQEGIKKMLSIEEEKQIKGTTKIFTRKNTGIAQKLNNAVSQIIETDDPNGDIRVVDLKTPDNALKDLYGIYVQAAKDALGVTEASQGRADGGASLSGKALEMLANNTAGRMSSKAFEKQIAFTELYQLYFDFLIAFYDEKRPFRTEGKDNNSVFGYFDKSKLIKQDSAGEWYYPEFDIYITTDSGLPKDKRFILDAANGGAGTMLDPIEYWMVMESIGFPNASAILDMEKEKKAQAEQQAQAQAQMPPQQGPTQGPPEQIPPQQPPIPQEQQPPQMDPQQIFEQLPPRVRQAIQQNVPPEQMEAFLLQDPEQLIQSIHQIMGGNQNGQ